MEFRLLLFIFYTIFYCFAVFLCFCNISQYSLKTAVHENLLKNNKKFKIRPATLKQRSQGDFNFIFFCRFRKKYCHIVPFRIRTGFFSYNTGVPSISAKGLVTKRKNGKERRCNSKDGSEK